MTVTVASRNNLLRGSILAVLSVFALSVTAPVIASADTLGGTATDNNANVTAFETKEALQDVPGILGASDEVAVETDADSAIVATAGGAAVDVPKDPEQGVTFGAANGPKIEVELPNADQAGTAKTVAPGVVAYDSGNGSANAVQVNEDGSVRMLTVIDNPAAPTEYDYKVNVPNGGHIELSTEGGAVVLAEDGKLLAASDKPWAKDANGNPVGTWFTTDGLRLVQHVTHNVPGVAYPVTADPRVSWSWSGMTLYLTRSETNMVAYSIGAVGAYFGWTGIGGLIAYSAGPAAQWATAHGYCLAIYKSNFYWAITTWSYRC